MKKMKLMKSALAVAAAFTLAAAPMSIRAEGLDDTDLAANLEDAVEATVGSLPSEGTEFVMNVEFGDGLYNLAAQSGGDASWLQNIYTDVKVVPGEAMLDSEAVIGLNDNDLLHVFVSVDPENGMFYLSVPELFDQAVSVDPQELGRNAISGSSSDGSKSGMYGAISQMIASAGTKIAGQLVEFFNSLPADVWQQEMSTYLMPVLSNLQQDASEDEITIGEASAAVQSQTFGIPSDKMGEIISGTLTSLSQDQVIESLLQSEAVTNICSLVSMLTGGQTDLSGEALLGMLRGALESAAAADYSSIPGFSVTVQKNEEGSAAGLVLMIELGGEQYEMLTFKAIGDGTEHCFEVIPGAVLLNMMGMYNAGSVDIIGQGSTENDLLNELVEVKMNDETVATFVIEDYDLAALQNGENIGSFRFEAGDQSAEIVYGVEDDGTRTIVYSINDEIFYNAAAWAGTPEDGQIDEIDLSSVTPITSVDDLMNWVQTIKTDEAMSLLEQAGVPVGGDSAEDLSA